MTSSSQLIAEPASANPYIAGLLGSYSFLPGATITVVLQANSGDAGLYGGALWDANGAREALLAAVASWNQVANIHIEVLSDNYQPGADRSAYTWVEQLGDLGPGVLGEHFLPGTGDLGGTFNNQSSVFSTANNQPGGYSFITFLHELGHGLGLTHPFDGPAVFPGVTEATGSGSLGDNALNTVATTIMNYDGSINNRTPSSDAFGWAGTPMAFDVAAIQHIYGANMATGAGDNVYLLPAVNGPGAYWQTIWDAGGTDTISAQGIMGTGIIDLQAATLENAPGGGGVSSYIYPPSYGPVEGGFFIANGVTIENAIGSDYGNTINGNAAANHIIGGAASDTIDGRAGNDLIETGGGDDYLDGGAGDDTMIGGTGNDRYYLDSVGDQIVELAGQGIDEVRSSLASYVLPDVMENLVLLDGAVSGTGNSLDNIIYAWGATPVSIFALGGNDVIIGTTAADHIEAGDGNDQVSSHGGGDFISGGGGNDTLAADYNGPDAMLGGATLHGNEGDDEYWIGNVNDLVIELPGEGYDKVVIKGALPSYHLPDNVEDVRAESGFDMVIYGNEGNNRIFGTYPTSETIYGGAGDDYISGRGAQEQLFGGTGNDIFIVDDSSTTVIEYDGEGIDEIQSSQSFSMQERGQNVETLRLTFIAEAGTGNDLANLIVGNGRDNLLSGGKGDDTLTGSSGNDQLDGGANIDTARVSGDHAAYVVTQTSTGVFTVAGPDGTDTLTNIEYLKFDDQTIRLLPGTGASVSFDTSDPSVYRAAMANIRDFDGNALGGDNSWLRIGSTDINGDGDIDQILVNKAIGRFAEVGTAADGKVYFDDHSWAGETRVVGIYVDPLVQSGAVVAGGDFDSQRRFQNDLQIENINRVLGSGDYDHDGLQEVYLALTDHSAYLHAYMHADGNIQYANYQSQAQVIDYLTSHGFNAATYDGWFG